MREFHSPAAFRAYCDEERAQGHRVGFVPTMGYLHAGHLSLMRLARQHADRVVVSLFVNPTQFGPHEDLDRYPRDLEGDRKKCEGEGVDVLFRPTVEHLYPTGEQTTVMVHELSQGLCGASREGHFRGVCTVVTKLFNIVGPCVAVFGSKDYQQLQVVRQMAHDLYQPVEIVEGPTVREADGVAMSSRNARLNAEERQAAVVLHRVLLGARERVQRRAVSSAALLAEARGLMEAEPLVRVDYVEVRGAESLREIEEARAGEAVMLVAAFVGDTRLIDNMRL
ncbi:MAG: pantoate--beta-alanine ligase [Deltaproteobacteria bacterium]|nr:pantoate--beta-alanine ligase [Deltaproteobacteria bacterium]